MQAWMDEEIAAFDAFMQEHDRALESVLNGAPRTVDQIVDAVRNIVGPDIYPDYIVGCLTPTEQRKAA